MERVGAVVIGAGVVGLAVGRALAQAGRETIVVDTQPGIGQGVSSRNSEVIHAGLYYTPGSLKARLCDGPLLLEAETYRWQGHYEGDAQPYKPEDEAEAWRARDPLHVQSERLVERGVASAEELEEIETQARARVDAAVERARSLPAPEYEEAFQHVFGD